MAKPPPISPADLDLLSRLAWTTADNDRRSKRLAGLRLCESIANEATAYDSGRPYTKVHWRTTDKGRLLLSGRALVTAPIAG